MPLTCELGWHRADPMARWNDGYYFSKCTRCGRDLVRTAYQGWHVPKGYRVVWQAQPPEPRRPRVQALKAASPPPPELPIQEVLRHLGNRDLSNDGGVGCEDEAQDAHVRSMRESVHVGTLRVGEVMVEHILVSEVLVQPVAPKPEESISEAADPELPFEVAEAPAEPTDQEPVTDEPAPVEEPAAQEAEAPVVEAPAPETPEPVQSEDQPPPPPVTVKTMSRIVIDDFMAEDPEPAPWDAPPPPRRPEPEQRVEPALYSGEQDAEGEDSFAVPAFRACAEEGADSPVFDAATFAASHDVDSIAALPDELEAAADEGPGAAKGGFRNLFSRKPALAQELDGAPPRENLRAPIGRRFAVAGSVVAGALVLAALVAERPQLAPVAAPQVSRPSAGVVPPAPPVKAKAQPAPVTQAKAIFPSRQRAFVTASIVNCRASPVEQAAAVKKLSRGAEVEIIAREADWLSISHKGRQCWASSRYVSPDRPA